MRLLGMHRDLYPLLDELAGLEQRRRIAVFRWCTKVYQYLALVIVMLILVALGFAKRTGEVDLIRFSILDIALILFLGPAILLCLSLLPVRKAFKVVGPTLPAEVRAMVLRESNRVFFIVLVLLAMVWVGIYYISHFS